MRFANRMALLLVASLATLYGCDWIPGSTLSWSQSVRTWDPLESDNCMVVGSYIFRTDATMPPFQGRASVRMRTENKDDQENLPRLFVLNYRLDDTIYYQQAFELNKGKGSISEIQPEYWDFEEGDTIDYEACAGGGGTIPIHTEISLKLSYKF